MTLSDLLAKVDEQARQAIRAAELGRSGEYAGYRATEALSTAICALEGIRSQLDEYCRGLNERCVAIVEFEEGEIRSLLKALQLSARISALSIEEHGESRCDHVRQCAVGKVAAMAIVFEDLRKRLLAAGAERIAAAVTYTTAGGAEPPTEQPAQAGE